MSGCCTPRLIDGYPRFSDAEMARRRAALEGLCAKGGVDHLLVYGANRVGSGVQWLTGWPATAEAAVVMSPGKPDALFVQYCNHVPLARKLAPACEVEWGGPSTLESVLGALARRSPAPVRLGVIGPLSFRLREGLAGRCKDVVDLNRDYVRLRLVKSDEEIAWMRIGADLSDRAIAALRDNLREGMTEWELSDLVERAYVPRGGTTHIHFIAVTAMAAPDRCVPAQIPSMRAVRRGDVILTEISASFWGYPGQVLRSFTVGARPLPLYRRLHEAAEAAFHGVCNVLRPGATPAQVVAAASVIEDAGFTTCDDLLHGFGGGYLPPVIGSRSRPAGPLPEMTFKAGMTVVVQPNVVTRDRRAGVQTGELVRITDDGIERLHHSPRGFYRIDL